jgi:hypothetical protein
MDKYLIVLGETLPLWIFLKDVHVKHFPSLLFSSSGMWVAVNLFFRLIDIDSKLFAYKIA